MVNSDRDEATRSHADCAAALPTANGSRSEHYENFPVASRLLPPSMRPHIVAVYAFARRADDFADEPGIDDAERLRLLTAWERRLHGDFTIRIPDQLGADEIFKALAHTIRSCRLPLSLFTDLLSAFRQDVSTKRIERGRCCSITAAARQTGRATGPQDCGLRGQHLDARSDALCTALQLTNFWQDLAIDWRRGGCTCLSMTGIAPAPATRISTEAGQS